MSKRATRITVNGKSHARVVDARLTLADFLRHELGLTGTHLGCEHGVCGACTVLVDNRSARSCLMFAVQALAADLDPSGDVQATGATKKHLAGVLLRRVAKQLMEQP